MRHPSSTVSPNEITRKANLPPEATGATREQHRTPTVVAVEAKHPEQATTGFRSQDTTPTTSSNETVVNVTSTHKTCRENDKRLPKIILKKKDEVKGGRVTVQSIIPHPTQKVIDDNHVALYEPKLRVRLQQLSTYVNKEANVYALGKLLPTATWGAFLPLADHQNELCNPSTNKPLTVWTVGHIATTWFARNGEPERQASIAVVPLSQSLIEQYNLLVGGLLIPPSHTTDSVGAVRAVKWQSEKGSSMPTLFEEVFDAREVFTNKKDMPDYLVTDLKKNDLVLIEGKVTKYRAKDEHNKWSLQHVQMELAAISLLHSNDYQHGPASNAHDIMGLHI
ncbi:hypothetical protein JVT61DRAFT_14025 [Boletus reticuloceps]|uniref:Uncharacterized protein n=1 Tax=Boletus reticuloceps TaxID=495285 RepID=A0A8I3ADC5_9AGAM|nr:hypothetical protein JVT61DRAFT_14025 [Boletus reticuloceps]